MIYNKLQSIILLYGYSYFHAGFSSSLIGSVVSPITTNIIGKTNQNLIQYISHIFCEIYNLLSVIFLYRNRISNSIP